MPDMSEDRFFEPRDDGAGTEQDDASAPGLTCVPTALLQRHGARVLDPSNAAAVPYTRKSGSGSSQAMTPNSTVYRARTLLIPADQLGDGNSAVVETIKRALANVGMSIAVPERPVRDKGPGGQILEQLPRPVVLVPAEPEQGKPARPVVVDAWVALQALRAAADVAGQDDVLSKEIVSKIRLEHLLIGSAVIAGSPSTDGNGVSGSPSTDGNGVTGPTSTNSYAYASGDTRVPVAVILDPPYRRPLEDCGSRRPVVAVLDTGIRAHPWLNVRPEPPGVKPTEYDGFVQIDPGMQDIIYAETKSVEDAGDQPRQLIKDPWDRPDTADPLIGELETTVGHSTFISGIVRQVAPDAEVLAIRIMHSDGVVNEYDLIEALSLLAERIANAQAQGGDMAKMVDVVSLSLGYFDESSADDLYSSGLWQVIKVLLDLGVAVVAAAGNFSTRRRFYPAALVMLTQPGVPLISVGALNPNNTKALFSDDGRWVTAWARGASVVSTYPDIRGCVSPQIEMKGREALDPDDYRGGFACWSGTSFAAPLLAARLAHRLLDNAADPGLALNQLGEDATAKRTKAALEKMGWRSDRGG